MTTLSVALRAVRFHWRTQLVAALFVGLATSVVVAALGVRSSISEGLRRRLVAPLGSVNEALVATGTFRQALAEPGQVPALVLRGTLSSEDGRSVPNVTVWGVPPGSGSLVPGIPDLADGRAAISRSVARALGAKRGDRAFIRLPFPDSAPLDSLFGYRTTDTSTFEAAVEIVDDGASVISLRPQLEGTGNVFVPLPWLQRQTRKAGRANVILSARPIRLDHLTLTDYGLDVTEGRGGAIVHSDSVEIPLRQEVMARRAGETLHVIVEAIRVTLVRSAASAQGMSSYALMVTGVPPRSAVAQVPTGGEFIGTTPQFVGSTTPHLRIPVDVNSWAAQDLGVKESGQFTLDLMLLGEDNKVSYRRVGAIVRHILPMDGAGGDPNIAPVVRGMTDSRRISDWHLPFPIDLSKITARDEAYWEKFRAAPKFQIDESRIRSLIPRLRLSSAIRFPGAKAQDVSRAMLAALRPADGELTVFQVRQQALEACEGSTNLAELILALGSFLFLASIALGSAVIDLNFRGRQREFDLMSALGLPRGLIGRVAHVEAFLVSLAGALVGLPMGVGTTVLCLALFDRWMPNDAQLTPPPISITFSDLIIGLAVGVGAGLLAILARRVPRRKPSARRSHSVRPIVASSSAYLVRAISARPGRFGLSAAVVMSGTAILAVAAASYQGAAGGGGTGDFALQVETTLPVPIDWSTAVGRDSAHFDPADEPLLSKATILGLLRSPGANVSCLNPVKPAIPRLIGVTATLASREPFSVDGTTWRGLMGPGGHEVRAFGDADSVEWILHSKLGGMIRLSRPGDSDAELQIAGLTHGSFLAGDLLVPDWAFRRLYRDVQAPTLFLIAAPESLVPKLEDAVRRNLSAYGVTIKRPRDIVASLRQVQNAYLSIFLVFGVLGLALAVVGTSLVSARNVLERRREFGLALAVGQPRSRVACWMVAETVLAIAAGALAGLTLGTLGGLAERATVSWPAIFVACVAVLGAGIAGTVGVAWFSLRRSLLDALRSE